MKINFDNSFAQQMKGFYLSSQGAEVSTPTLIKFNHSLADELGIDVDDACEAAQVFSGNQTITGSMPLAQVYAGHQFGQFSPQLGDGRALLLGELVDQNGRRYDIQLKGSGRTAYSRGGDGKAGLGPVLREYILSEAMYAMGIPTTRALAAVATGETIMRDKPLPGAVFTRVASSHIRIGTFQYFASRSESNKVKQLADYVIARHYPKLELTDNPYLKLLECVSNAQACLVAQWMLIGFIHGVMNTDNMTVSGETIDYGPCAFMDRYDPETVFSSIDRYGRYAYKNQPVIAQWNLARFAETLLPRIDSNQDKAIDLATQCVNQFPKIYSTKWLQGMGEKIGIDNIKEDDSDLVNDLLAEIHEHRIDYTNLFRDLARYLSNEDNDVYTHFANTLKFEQWLTRWRLRLDQQSLTHEQSVELMNKVNPLYIPRNHKVEEALEAAISHQDFSKFESLLEVLSEPYQWQANRESYAQPAPGEFADYKTFCGT